MRMYQVESGDIDDRISWLEMEVSEGQRSPRIRQIAGRILTGKTVSGDWSVPERDWEGEVDAAYNFVRQHVRYTRDIHNVELFQKPDRTLQLKIGDCDDLTILLGSILGSIGYPLRFRVVGLGGNSFQHVYLLAGIPPHDVEKWKPLDPSRAEGPGWEVTENVTIKQDYEVSSE